MRYKRKGGKGMNALQIADSQLVDFSNERKEKNSLFSSCKKSSDNKYLRAIKSLSPEEMRELSDLVEDKEN